MIFLFLFYTFWNFLILLSDLLLFYKYLSPFIGLMGFMDWIFCWDTWDNRSYWYCGLLSAVSSDRYNSHCASAIRQIWAFNFRKQKIKFNTWWNLRYNKKSRFIVKTKNGPVSFVAWPLMADLLLFFPTTFPRHQRLSSSASWDFEWNRVFAILNILKTLNK